jgi:ssDNA-binding Zn-finger/Zn-ribbon topoisomerase 1
MIKPLTRKEILEANKKNPCGLETCPNCGCDVIEQKITYSKVFIEDAWISGCPKCNYSFCN